MSRLGWALLAVAACGCGPPVSTPVPQPVPAARNDLRWFRASAEYPAIANEVFLAASARLPDLTRSLENGKWAVIADADETLLDNSANERRLADRGESFSESQWADWVRQGAATAIPGAVAFVAQVHALGGRLVVVSNRAESLCDATRANLARVSIVADLVLCETGGVADKNPRFRRVQNGTASADLPSLAVVEWIGDNIQDFPDLTQAIRTRSGAYAEFGRSYFVLPNPMYGSWEHNTEP